MTLCNIEQPKVLIVDTDKLRRVILVYECRKAGYSVLATERRRDALAAMKFFHPDLVLTELDLPDEDGIGLIRAIRGKRTYRNIGIIAMSLTNDEETRTRALEAGANEFLQKPVSPRTLIATLQNFIQPFGAGDEEAQHIFI